jgi:hypothetical protein
LKKLKSKIIVNYNIQNMQKISKKRQSNLKMIKTMLIRMINLMKVEKITKNILMVSRKMRTLMRHLKKRENLIQLHKFLNKMNKIGAGQRNKTKLIRNRRNLTF